MSWDVIAAKFPSDLQNPQELPNKWKPPTIGRRSDLANQIASLFSASEYSVEKRMKSDDSDLAITGPSFSVSVFLHGAEEEPSQDDVIESISLHSHGDAAPHVAAVLDALSLRGIDSGSGRIVDARDLFAGLEQYKTFRDRAFDQMDRRSDRREPEEES